MPLTNTLDNLEIPSYLDILSAHFLKYLCYHNDNIFRFSYNLKKKNKNSSDIFLEVPLAISLRVPLVVN